MLNSVLHDGDGRLAQLLRLLHHVPAKRPDLLAPVRLAHCGRQLSCAFLDRLRHGICDAPQVEAACCWLLGPVVDDN